MRTTIKKAFDTLYPTIWDFVELMRLDKPVGIYLLLWPTAWALCIAGSGEPDLQIVLVFIAGVILMRSAGCAINDFADRDFDGQVARTDQRPLVTGRLHARHALICTAILLLLAFILVLQLNRLTFYWSIGAVLIASIYPFMKRYTYLPQVVLGAAFAWSIPMAFSALQNKVPAYAWLLYLATVLWTIAYDTIYAMVDRDDDIEAGIKSTAILFGDADKIMIGILQCTTIFSFIFLARELNFSWVFYIFLSLACGLFIYQQVLIQHRLPEKCFQAFKHNSWVGMVIFLGIASHYFFN